MTLDALLQTFLVYYYLKCTELVIQLLVKLLV